MVDHCFKIRHASLACLASLNNLDDHHDATARLQTAECAFFRAPNQLGWGWKGKELAHLCGNSFPIALSPCVWCFVFYLILQCWLCWLHQSALTPSNFFAMNTPKGPSGQTPFLWSGLFFLHQAKMKTIEHQAALSPEESFN